MWRECQPKQNYQRLEDGLKLVSSLVTCSKGSWPDKQSCIDYSECFVKDTTMYRTIKLFVSQTLAVFGLWPIITIRIQNNSCIMF